MEKESYKEGKIYLFVHHADYYIRFCKFKEGKHFTTYSHLYKEQMNGPCGGFSTIEDAREGSREATPEEIEWYEQKEREFGLDYSKFSKKFNYQIY